MVGTSPAMRHSKSAGRRSAVFRTPEQRPPEAAFRIRIGSPYPAARARDAATISLKAQAYEAQSNIAQVEGSGTAPSKPYAQRACTGAVG